MPATATGRGGQVILDGAAQTAARGGYSTSLEGNLARKLDLEAAGTFASGSSSDGTTSTGIAAEDPVLVNGGGAEPVLILEQVMAESLTATTITALATAAVVKAASTTRKTLDLYNTGTGTIYFGYSSAVTASNGVPLAPAGSALDQGGSYSWGLGAAPPVALYVYSTAGSTVIVKEGT